VAAKAFAYFLFFSTLALIVGLIVGNIVRPGAGLNIDPASLDAGKVAAYAAKAHEASVTGFLMAMIPETFLSSLEGNILQVLVVAILFGIALATTGARRARVVALLEDVSVAFFRLVAIVMKAAPVGAFGAMAFTIGKYGIDSLANLVHLVLTFYLTSALFVLVVLGVSRGWRVFDPAADRLSQGGTAAGAGHVLVGKRAARADRQDGARRLPQGGGRPGRAHRLQLQPRWHQHLHDAGGAVHRAGLQRGTDAGPAGAAARRRHAVVQGRGGVTGAGFITLAATLSIVPSLPVAGMALILGVDRFMSECRSLTNFIGNAVATVVVSR
jgi:aerobic C4-dicarboxylate transport protein